jgi:HEAT repeat protein
VSCKTCREELEHLSETWANLGMMLEAKPGPIVRKRFYAMLEGASTRQSATSLRQSRSDGRGRFLPVIVQAAAALVLVAGGWLMGSTFGANGRISSSGVQYDELVADIPLREEIDLALKKPSTSKRMLGVALISRMPKPDSSLATPLLELLVKDPSLQVRLAAVDALDRYSDHPWVRERLIEALSRQKSPRVQVALLDLLGELRDRDASEAMESLIREPWLSPEVRESALNGLSRGPLKSL